MTITTGDLIGHDQLIASIPMITDTARYVLALLLFACVAALVVAVGVWRIGRHENHPQASSRGGLGLLVGLGATTAVLLLILLYVL